MVRCDRTLLAQVEDVLQLPQAASLQGRLLLLLLLLPLLLLQVTCWSAPSA
jgi:hypothetical protein